MNMPEWYYDEMKQIGTDYENEEEVRTYDERMGKFRDMKGEALGVIEAIGLKQEDVLLEIGCGTAELAICASENCSRVIAADISPVMLSYAEKKAHARGRDNITFIRAGFLSYEHEGELLDAVASQIAFHHLPDFWKLIALKRLAGMLKPAGMLYLRDFVFSFNPDKYEKSISYAVEGMRSRAGDETARNFERHIKLEYSTYDWIMEEMLYRAGFDILTADYGEDFMTVYVCKKY